jgi:hypothetical protein
MSEESNTSEPAFAGAARPSNGSSSPMGSSTTSSYAPPVTTPGFAGGAEGLDAQDSSRRMTIMGIGFSWIALAAAGAGVWLFLRKRREENRPINRIRRRAQQAAIEIRERVPSTADEAARPALGLTTALVSVGLLLWQQSRSRAHRAEKMSSRHGMRRMGRKASKKGRDAVSDIDWQARLNQLKERWSPTRLELEKVQISRR